MTFKQLIYEHFREILLVTMFFVLIGVGVHLSHIRDVPSISWVHELTSQTLTAILGLAAGVRVGQIMEQKKNGTGEGSSKPAAPVVDAGGKP